MRFFNPRRPAHNAPSGPNTWIRNYDSMPQWLLWFGFRLITMFSYNGENLGKKRFKICKNQSAKFVFGMILYSLSRPIIRNYSTFSSRSGSITHHPHLQLCFFCGIYAQFSCPLWLYFWLFILSLHFFVLVPQNVYWC